jgi:hypothetical protein
MVFKVFWRRSSSAFQALGALMCVSSMAACSSAGQASPPLSFAAQADMEEKGDAGVLEVQVRASPDPPWQGTIAVELTVMAAADGIPQDGLSIAMVPWMPAHGHGTSLTPVVTPEGNGKYLVTQVDLFMAGYWELQTTLSGPLSDYVAPGYNIP